MFYINRPTTWADPKGPLSKGVITVTVTKRNIDEARVYFARVGTDLLTPTDEAVREIQNKLLEMYALSDFLIMVFVMVSEAVT
ncbi:MAG: hypothetical protein U0N22_01250 [Acutalibacter sp.]